MITKITILSNGSIAPNKVIKLGYQYESVGDILQFDIPREYQGYHYYLAFYMKKHNTILLPVNLVEGKLQFVISTTITKNSGNYEIVFLATENKVVNGNIDEARKVFVSTTMIGNVIDNFLVDPVVDEELDPNLQIIYDELYDLHSTVQQDLANDAYRGAAYVPDLTEDGFLSWTRTDGKDINIPKSQNITGPQGKQGPHYTPSVTEGVITWTGSQEGMAVLPQADLNPEIKKASDTYLNANLATEVTEQINNTFKWEWDPVNKILKITTDHINTGGK